MKIIYCSDTVIPDRPANTIQIMKMCHSFANAGHDVTLLAHEYANPPVVTEDEYAYYGVKRNFEIVRLPCPGFSGGALIYAFYALRFIKNERPDIVFGRSLYCCFLAAKKRICPVIYEAHVEENKKSQFFFKRMICSPAFKRLVVITARLKDHFLKKYPLADDNVLVSPDGADILQVTIPFRRELIDCDKYKMNVGYTGHLYDGRGIDVIIDTAKLCPEICFHIVGGNEKNLSFWKTQCDGIPNVIFYGYVPPSDVAQYGLQFDALLAPYQNRVYAGTNKEEAFSIEEWFSPLKIFEYMSYKKPIVCSDLPVLHEVLTDGYNCILCPPGDVEAWATALRRLMEEPELAVKISTNAYDDFVEKYTWDQRAKNVIADI